MELFKRNASRVAGLMVLWMALAGAVHAGPSRPFKGSLDLEERMGRLGRCPGPQGSAGVGGVLSGSGHATHLGKVLVGGEHCIDSEAGTPPPSFRLFDGRMVLRAANGDVVMADYSGVFTLAAAGSYTFDGEYHITGGTGRFEDASGSGALSGLLEGVVPSFSQTVSIDIAGRIAY